MTCMLSVAVSELCVCVCVCVTLLQALVHDIHVVCGCLKDFLRGLKEPLVTFQLWNAFTSAVGELKSLTC